MSDSVLVRRADLLEMREVLEPMALHADPNVWGTSSKHLIEVIDRMLATRQSQAEPCRECNVCADFAPLPPKPGLRCCQRCGHVMCPNRAKVCQHGIYADLCLPQCNLEGA